MTNDNWSIDWLIHSIEYPFMIGIHSIGSQQRLNFLQRTFTLLVGPFLHVTRFSQPATLSNTCIALHPSIHRSIYIYTFQHGTSRMHTHCRIHDLGRKWEWIQLKIMVESMFCRVESFEGGGKTRVLFTTLIWYFYRLLETCLISYGSNIHAFNHSCTLLVTFLLTYFLLPFLIDIHFFFIYVYSQQE